MDLLKVLRGIHRYKSTPPLSAAQRHAVTIVLIMHVGCTEFVACLFELLLLWALGVVLN